MSCVSYRFSTDTYKIVDLLFKLHIKTYLQAEENYFDMVEKQQTAVMSLRTAHTPAYNNFFWRAFVADRG